MTIVNGVSVSKWHLDSVTYLPVLGADTLEELFEMLKALIECFDQAGIQVKASKLLDLWCA